MVHAGSLWFLETDRLADPGSVGFGRPCSLVKPVPVPTIGYRGNSVVVGAGPDEGVFAATADEDVVIEVWFVYGA